MRDSITNQGSVEDIRCSLFHIDPVSEQFKGTIRKTINWLKLSVEYEQHCKNRSTVIKMVEQKIKTLERYAQGT